MERLSDTVQNALINIVTIFLGLSVGAKLVADKFRRRWGSGAGVIAFCVGTAAGVLMAKLMNVFSRHKINPLIGSAGCRRCRWRRGCRTRWVWKRMGRTSC